MEPGDKPSKPAASAAAAKPPLWSFDRYYRYTWRAERRVVGETVFRLRRPADPGQPIAVEVRFRLDKAEQETSMERRYLLDKNGRVEGFDSSTRLAAVGGRRSQQDGKGRISAGRLELEITNNEAAEQRTRSSLEIPPEGFVLLPDAVEFWALWSRELLPRVQKRTVPIAFPYFEKVFEVAFVPGERVKLPLGTQLVECQGWSFSSSDRQLQGEIWLDADGRLVRYKQGTLTVDLEAPAAEPGAAK